MFEILKHLRYTIINMNVMNRHFSVFHYIIIVVYVVYSFI